jgi:isopropylmalate/homocitrate/citramalate synthase
MELLDVTLREGEQRAGHSYTVEQKVAAARTLDDLGVDYVQVGFPVADDRTARVCERVDLDAKTTGIARAVERDVVAAAESGVDVIDLFAPTSDRQRERVLGSSRSELVETVREAHDRARETGREVHFTAMDGFRTDPAFLNELRAELEPTRFTVADTVGSNTPRTVTETLDALDGDLSTVGVHFHDDLGVSTGNALAAAACGVGKVDVSVAGLGERAGNTPLEELLVSGSVGGEAFETDVDLAALLPAVESVLDTLAEDVDPQKPLLGEGVFEHESGLHTAAMLDDPATFEPFDPAQFGGERRLLFGAASGRGAATRLLERAGAEPTESLVDALLARLQDRETEATLDEAVEMAEAVAAEEQTAE